MEMEERFKLFTVLISDLNRCIRKLKTEEMAEYQLKSPHVSCLYYLYKASPMTAKELCDICAEDKANISRSIEYLESNGFLICCTQQQKRYKAPLMLTEKGKDVARRLSERVDQVLEEAGNGVSEEDRAIMYRSLICIHRNLQKMCDAYDS